jgi:SAM-dependent methyltransferase
MWPAEDLIRILLGSYPKLPRLKTSGSALDLGCGDGRNAKFLHSLGFDTYAVEVNEEITNYLSRNNPGIVFKPGGNQSIPFEDSFFDLIVSWHALYYLDNQNDLVEDNISEIRRCLKAGAWLIACIPLPTNFIYRDSVLVRSSSNSKIQYRQIRDFFGQRTGAILGCFSTTDSYLSLMQDSGFSENYVGFRRGDWFGLSYDWFTVVSRKNH